jgi:RNA polymerase sigma-70 factor (ECF subfamily)
VRDPGLGPEELAVRGEEERSTEVLIASLPEHYRIVVMLRHQQGLSYEEIAETLRLPLGTVKARIHRARGLLRERLERES